MADPRSTFPTLEDDSGVGAPLTKTSAGDSATGKVGSVGFGVQDDSGNVQLIHVAPEGSAPNKGQNVFAAKDNAGNSAFIPLAAPGDAPTKGPNVFAFRDNSGNLVMPQLDASGRLPVTTAATGTSLYARGEITGGSATLTTVATITLTASKSYANVQFICSCGRDALYQVIQNDNGTLTNLADIVVGPGSPTFSETLQNISFTAGATGTQQLLVKALNENTLSALRATVSVLQTN